MSTAATATAIAHANIALVKYWGKRDPVLNLPATGSLSITLRDLTTRTRVRFHDGAEDRVTLDGAPAAEPMRDRVSRFLDRVREAAGITARAEVITANDFPTGAGLASSASGFAALALAATRAAGLSLSPARLSALARRGSGSAARSLYGGYVEMHRGERPDGTDAFAEPVAAAEHLPLAVGVAITHEGPKETGSTEGMASSAATAPYWDAWVASAPRDLHDMRAAIRAADLARVGELAEHSCFKMHALMLASRPPLLYWNEATVAVIHAVRRLRAAGTPAWVTVDAGPQVKVLSAPEHGEAVASALESVPGVRRVLRTRLGPAAHLVDEASEAPR